MKQRKRRLSLAEMTILVAAEAIVEHPETADKLLKEMAQKIDGTGRMLADSMRILQGLDPKEEK